MEEKIQKVVEEIKKYFEEKFNTSTKISEENNKTEIWFDEVELDENQYEEFDMFMRKKLGFELTDTWKFPVMATFTYFKYDMWDEYRDRDETLQITIAYDMVSDKKGKSFFIKNVSIEKIDFFEFEEEFEEE